MDCLGPAIFHAREFFSADIHGPLYMPLPLGEVNAYILLPYSPTKDFVATHAEIGHAKASAKIMIAMRAQSIVTEQGLIMTRRRPAPWLRALSRAFSFEEDEGERNDWNGQ
jgi:hypothetical protein